MLHAGALDRPGSVKGGPYRGAVPGGGQFGTVRVRDAYIDLARTGVVRIVNMRTGAADDRLSRSDARFLEGLGVEVVSIPVADGTVPSPGQLDAILRAIRTSPGRVYVHCSAGVGRSTAVEAAYRPTSSKVELLAAGPLTIEQLWFVIGGSRAPRAVEMASRLADWPRQELSRLKTRLL